MRKRNILFTTAALSMLSMPLCAQAPAATAPKGAAAASKPFVVERTVDGQPDMQGMYTRNGVVGMEAKPPANPIAPNGSNPLSVSARSDGLGPYPKIFQEGGSLLRGEQRGGGRARRGGIVDPADRVLPWRPEEDAKRREFLVKMNPAADLHHVEMNALCALPGLFQGEDGNNPFQFVQAPGKVLILYDYNHTSRLIHLDGRPHLGKDIRLFMGDSVGRWEGNTLIVDTTNFNDRTSYSREIPYLTDALHTVERFTITDANTIEYEATIDDPGLFTKPWTVAGDFTRVPKGTESFEFACAEGSQTLVNMFGRPPVR